MPYTKSECIIGGRVTRKGYAYVYVWLDGRRRQVLGHRLAWEQAHGPIPPRMQVHHICRVKSCVNVEHLELHTARAHRALHRLCNHPDRRVQANGISYCRVCKADYIRKRLADPVFASQRREWTRIADERKKERYRTDPEYRERVLEKNREYRARKAGRR